MAPRITVTRIETTARNVFDAAQQLGLIPQRNADGSVPELVLQRGNTTNGVAWRFWVTATESRGLSNPLGLADMAFLGWTARETWDRLNTIHDVLTTVLIARTDTESEA